MFPRWTTTHHRDLSGTTSVFLCDRLLAVLCEVMLPQVCVARRARVAWRGGGRGCSRVYVFTVARARMCCARAARIFDDPPLASGRSGQRWRRVTGLALQKSGASVCVRGRSPHKTGSCVPGGTAHAAVRHGRRPVGFTARLMALPAVSRLPLQQGPSAASVLGPLSQHARGAGVGI